MAAKKQELDWLGAEVLAVFEMLGFDAAYIESKRYDLAGRDRLGVLRFCSGLDNRCLTALAERLGLPVEDLKTTIKTIGAL